MLFNIGHGDRTDSFLVYLNWLLAWKHCHGNGHYLLNSSVRNGKNRPKMAESCGKFQGKFRQ